MVARLTVVSSKPSLLENVKELWEHNLFDYFQIYPGIEASDKSSSGSFIPVKALSKTSKATMNDTFLAQLTDLLDIYPALFKKSNRFRGVLEYERIVDMILSGKMALGHCSAGRTYFTISPDDSIVPCHRLVGKQEFQIEPEHGELNRDNREWTLPVDSHAVCSQCWARYVCGGNCLQENFVATGNLRKLNSETCLYQRQLLEGMIRILGRAEPFYKVAPRQRLSDLFVSCGRPVIPNERIEEKGHMRNNLHHFRLLR